MIPSKASLMTQVRTFPYQQRQQNGDLSPSSRREVVDLSKEFVMASNEAISLNAML